MCRWLAYAGQATWPEQFLFKSQYSLIQQSLCARKSRSVVNGDGFGLGWYGARTEPGLFRDILPAWADENLKSLSQQIQSPLFMAHVRAATDTPTSRVNCHPFRHLHYLFMHNGQIGEYPRIKRYLEQQLDDAYYRHRCGSTDSELLFLLLLQLGAAQDYTGAIERLISLVNCICRQRHVAEPFRLTAAFSDGRRLYVVRYASDDQAPTLFYRRLESGMLLVSEPIDAEIDCWCILPDASCLSVEPGLPPVFHQLNLAD